MSKDRWHQAASFDNHFSCTQCGKKGIPLSRKNSAARKAGHLKKLYCLHCRKETNHVEWKEWTHYDKGDFAAEFIGDNFSNEGLRKQEFSIFKTNIQNQKKINYNSYKEQCLKILEAIENEE